METKIITINVRTNTRSTNVVDSIAGRLTKNRSDVYVVSVRKDGLILDVLEDSANSLIRDLEANKRVISYELI